MLKFYLEKGGEAYRILFDLPVPGEALAHGEFRSFTDLLFQEEGAELVFNKEEEVSGIRGSLVSFFDFIDRALPIDDAGPQKELLTALLRERGFSEKEGLEVNFHQKPFDTPLRYWNFTLNQGHFIPYLFNRINWYLGPQKGYVTPFPLHVDVESASTCNMNCPMCYRDQLKETGQIDVDLFKRVVDECSDNNLFSIRLSWRGETLTHPRIREIIAYATKRVPNVSFLTNAFYIDEAMADCFIESGLSYIAVSFDGIGETYEAIRHPAGFLENYRRLAMLRDKREKAGTTLPQVRLCTIWPAIKDDPQGYYDTMKAVSDYIVTNPYINFRGPMEIKPDFICQYPWERMMVAFDGKTQCCTGWDADDIILGNAADTSIGQMWRSPAMDRIRRLHSEGRRMELSSCAGCRHGSAGDPDADMETILGRGY